MCKLVFFIEVHILHTRDTRVLKELSKICLQYCTISNCPSYTTAPHVCGIYYIMLYISYGCTIFH